MLAIYKCFAIKILCCLLLSLCSMSAISLLAPGHALAARRGAAARTVPAARQKDSFRFLPYFAFGQGPYSVRGNQVVDFAGRPYTFHGVTRDGLEYSCTGVGPMDAQHLAYMGHGPDKAGVTYWNANTIRLPLSESFWLYGAQRQKCTAQQYQALVHKTVSTLVDQGMNVMLDLHWVDADRQSLGGGGPWALPDADSVTFWQQVASAYRDNPNVIFELYNEPHPTSWQCWYSQSLCSKPITDTVFSDDCHCKLTLTYQSVGMRQLLDAVRGTGAQNIVIVAGINWGFDLSKVTNYDLPGGNIVYDTHPYPYDEKQAASWDSFFGNLSDDYPVISAENGQYDCKSDYMRKLYDYFDQHNIGWIGWAWSQGNSVCGYPLLTQDMQGTPSAEMGKFIYQRLQSYYRPRDPWW